MQTDFEYATCIVIFINGIIRYFIKLEDKAKSLQSNILLAFLDKSDSNFILKLNVNSNTVVMRFQIYLSTHNIIYYKYKTIVTGQYRFEFSYSMNK